MSGMSMPIMDVLVVVAVVNRLVAALGSVDVVVIGVLNVWIGSAFVPVAFVFVMNVAIM
jgi:hypothetical protein